ncbi:MAG: hypothetical protein HYR91_02310 [Flavobacteriia bacterium]|nr:hypothetical protein [Flavobacteriia bacterium]
MKKTLTYFVFRGLILGGFIILLGWIYQKWFYVETLNKEGWLKKIGDTSFSKKANILYFSASPNASFPESDTDRRSIHEKIQFYLNNNTIEALDTGAIHAGIFLHALQQLPQDYKPKIILMDLNLRSFGKMWIHSGLENSLQRNLVYWNNYPGLYNRIKASLKNYPYLPLHEREALINYSEKFDVLPFKKACYTIKKWVDSLNFRADHYDGIGREFVRNFGFQINESNEMLKNYREVVAFCKLQKLKLVFLILPENIESMRKNSGENLVKLCDKNIKYLKFQFKNIPIIDLSNKLNSSYFYETFPTEHYNQEGREIVAKCVGTYFKKLSNIK